MRTLDPDLRRRHPDLDLARAYAARNWIAHGYAVADYGIVWNAATQPAPKMVAAARALLQGRS